VKTRETTQGEISEENPKRQERRLDERVWGEGMFLGGLKSVLA
jgi:hypothetical protein